MSNNNEGKTNDASTIEERVTTILNRLNGLVQESVAKDTIKHLGIQRTPEMEERVLNKSKEIVASIQDMQLGETYLVLYACLEFFFKNLLLFEENMKSRK